MDELSPIDGRRMDDSTKLAFQVNVRKLQQIGRQLDDIAKKTADLTIQHGNYADPELASFQSKLVAECDKIIDKAQRLSNAKGRN